MFYSRYLPVKVKSKNECAVYTNDKVFPADLLEQAFAYVSGSANANNNVFTKDMMITFKSNPDVMWSLPEIIMAHDALNIARDCNFSYFLIYNDNNIPMYFVSSRFNNARILVDALTMRSIVVTKPVLVKKLSSMIGKKFADIYLVEFYNMIVTVEAGRHKYLDGVIVDRYSDEAFLTVNPLMDIEVEHKWWGFDELDELEKIVYEQATETEVFEYNGYLISKKDCNVFTPITVEYAHSLLDLRQRLLEKKTDYFAMRDEINYDPVLYLSTNFRYLVNANTLECATMTNITLQEWVRSYAANEYNSKETLNLLWEMAKTGVRD